jgi:hypothetical protein
MPRAPPTKTEHLSADKCSVFVYPALRADDMPQQVADDTHAFGAIRKALKLAYKT